MINDQPAEPDENEIILLTRAEWQQAQAMIRALNTTQRMQAEQVASLYASLLYPGNLEARVTASRTKYRELLELLGYPTEETVDADPD